MPLGTLRRWEQTGKPPRYLAYIVNCAIALGCDDRLSLVEESWLTWTPLPGRADEPPRPPTHDEPAPPMRPRRGDREEVIRELNAENFEREFLGGL